MENLKNLFSVPVEVEQYYEHLADDVMNANGLTRESAREFIDAVEKKYHYYLAGMSYKQDGDRRLILEKNRLFVLRDLNLATNEERTRLLKINEDFERLADELSTTLEEDTETIRTSLESIVMNFGSLDEAREILLHGPIINGFDNTADPQMENSFVREFLIKTFGLRGLRMAKIAHVNKDDRYIIFRHDVKKGNEFVTQGIAEWESSVLVFKNRAAYELGEMFMEKAAGVDALSHIYKIRATAGNTNVFHEIKLRSFGVECVSDYEYLQGLECGADEKLRLFMLGTIAHEVAHGLYSQTPSEIFNEYRKIIDEEGSPARNKYVTEYVSRHKKVYESDDLEIQNEDFAEAVRIFVTNPEYLIKNYPRRVEFIKRNFTFIKAGIVVFSDGALRF